MHAFADSINRPTPLIDFMYGLCRAFIAGKDRQTEYAQRRETEGRGIPALNFTNTPLKAATSLGEILEALNEGRHLDQQHDRETFDAAGIRVPKVRKPICVSDAATHAH